MKHILPFNEDNNDNGLSDDDIKEHFYDLLDKGYEYSAIDTSDSRYMNISKGLMQSELSRVPDDEHPWKKKKICLSGRIIDNIPLNIFKKKTENEQIVVNGCETLEKLYDGSVLLYHVNTEVNNLYGEGIHHEITVIFIERTS